MTNLTATITNGKLNVHDKAKLAETLSALHGQEVVVTIKKATQSRTLTQNAAIHLYYRLLADAFNEAGLDVRQVFKPEADIPVTPELVKEQMWKPIQRALTKKESTTRLTTKEVNEVFEVMHRHISEKFGINVPFPTREFGDIE
jgi:hypothetical protein